MNEKLKIHPIHFVLSEGLDAGANLFNFYAECGATGLSVYPKPSPNWPNIHPEDIKIFRQYVSELEKDIDELTKLMRECTISHLNTLNKKEFRKIWKKRQIIEYGPVEPRVLEDFITEAIKSTGKPLSPYYPQGSFNLQRGSKFYQGNFYQLNNEVILQVKKIKAKEVNIDNVLCISKRDYYEYGWEEKEIKDDTTDQE